MIKHNSYLRQTDFYNIDKLQNSFLYNYYITSKLQILTIANKKEKCFVKCCIHFENLYKN